MRSILFSMTLVLFLVSSSPVLAETVSDATTYPLSTCIVSGETLGEHGDVVTREVDGREIRLCCEECVEKLEADQAGYLKALDNVIIATQLADYPASTCPISGQPLGSMGDPYDYVFDGKLVRFCCAGCTGQFNENPTEALATIYGEATDQTDTENADAADSPEDEHDHSGHKH